MPLGLPLTPVIAGVPRSRRKLALSRKVIAALIVGRGFVVVAGPVAGVAFSPDGQQIVTGSPSLGDGTARVWEAARPDQVAAWEEEEAAAAQSKAAWQQELATLLREQADK